MAIDSDLAGIAIWALGYDGDYPELWQALDSHFSVSGTPTPGCVNNGDVNDDSILSSEDAQIAFSIAIGLYEPTFEEECAADCNADGTVSAGDAQAIFQAVVFGGFCSDPI